MIDVSPKTPFEEKRLGRVLLSEPFVTGARSRDVFKDFAILLAMPRYNEPGIIVYYGAHPDFEPFDGNAKDSPYYDPYWNEDGFYFKNALSVNPAVLTPEPSGLSEFLLEVDRLMMTDYGMGTQDVDDYNWNDEFDSGVPAEDAYEEWKIHTEGGRRSPANF